MREVDAIFVDAGGVFLLPDPVPVTAALERVGVTPDLAAFERAHYAGIHAWDAYPRFEERTFRAYLTALARELGAPPDRLERAVDTLLAGWGDVLWSRVIDASAKALVDLADLGVELAVVSNSDGSVERLLRDGGVCQVGPGSGVAVRAVIDSNVVGVAKPDPGIFHVAAEATGVPPERSIHVGDSVLTDVQGARAAGARPMHLDPYRMCVAADHEHVTSLAEVRELLDGREIQSP